MAWIYYNGNPAGRDVGDCSVRAVSVALGIDWEQAFALIATAAYNMGDMPSSDSGDMVSQLEKMMNEAPNDQIRQEFRNMINKVRQSN